MSILPTEFSNDLSRSAIVYDPKANRGQAYLATKSVEEVDIPAPLLPITQLELKAQLLLARPTPQERPVRCVRGRVSWKDGCADELILDGWFVPAVLVDETVVVRIATRWVGDEPDIGLRAGAAGNGTRVILCWKLGNIDL